MTPRKNMSKTRVLLYIVLLTIVHASPNQILARNYYVDALEGKDSNSGTSEKMAWNSLSKVRALKLDGGDTLYLKRGQTHRGILELNAQGDSQRRAVVDAYGMGRKPIIEAPDSSMWAVMAKNPDFLTIQNLEIVNTGTSPMAGRTGIKIEAIDCGICHDIELKCLDIRDVNGSLIKADGGGSAILIVNGGKEKSSIFDGLLIEDCTIRRCQRNGMIWNGISDRQNWHPNRRVVVRKNLIEGVPGDGIVPIGCDGAIIEYNLMRDCPGTLPHSEAAAGFWPWSCDNTVLRFNEVSNHRAPWDGQAYDSDYNCQNTVIEYNYSHDNDGGLALICCYGADNGVGNQNTMLQYNLSVNDGLRPRAARNGIFSPQLHIAGPCSNTLVHRNIFHVNPKAEPWMDHNMITSDNWEGYANNTAFTENLFFAPEAMGFNLTKSTCNFFDGNMYFGLFKEIPEDSNPRTDPSLYLEILDQDSSGKKSLDFLLDSIVVGDGAALLRTINPNSIEYFFQTLTTK